MQDDSDGKRKMIIEKAAETDVKMIEDHDEDDQVKQYGVVEDGDEDGMTMGENYEDDNHSFDFCGYF